MPTTVSSIFIFVALLMPGFVYLARTESRLPGQQYTALRETASIVSASLLSNILVLAAFEIVRTVWPGGTPDAGAIVRDPGDYFQAHYVDVTVWSAALLLLAIGVAAIAAVPPAWSESFAGRIDVWPAPPLRSAIARRRRSSISPESGWGSAFFRYPDRIVHLGLRLRDGTYLYGRLLEFNPQIEESDDRSLQLAGPVEIRTPTADRVELLDADAVVIAASEVKTISVHYLPED